MAKAGARVDELVVVDDTSASAIAERVDLAIRAAKGCVLTHPSVDQFMIAEVVRRFGLKRTRSLSVRLIREPHRIVVALLGEIDPRRLVQLKAAIVGRTEPANLTTFVPPEHVAAPAFIPSPDWFASADPLLDDLAHTVLRSRGAHRAGSPDGSRPAEPPYLHLGDGRRIALLALTLIGRDPVPRPHETDATQVRLDDLTVSKTHAAIEWDGRDVWIEDRGSTNGSSFIAEDGTAVDLVVGGRVSLALPSTVLLGDCEIIVDR